MVNFSTSGGKEYSFNVNEKCKGKVSPGSKSSTSCRFDIEIGEKLEKPVYIYIGYKNFFVNHRNIMNSVDNTQLSGTAVNIDRARGKCKGRVFNEDGGKTSSFKGSSLEKREVMYPCGLQASLIPAEVISLSGVTLTSKNIIPSGVKGTKFKNGPDGEKKQWADIENGTSNIY